MMGQPTDEGFKFALRQQPFDSLKDTFFLVTHCGFLSP